MRERIANCHSAAAAASVVILLVVGCSESGERAQEDAVPAAETPSGDRASIEGPASVQLTAEFLEGEWCYTHYMAGAQRNDENINYVFNADGTLRYQNNSNTAVDRPGGYEIDGAELKINPVFAAFTLTASLVTETEFVLSGLGDHHFARGACR